MQMATRLPDRVDADGATRTGRRRRTEALLPSLIEVAASEPTSPRATVGDVRKPPGPPSRTPSEEASEGLPRLSDSAIAAASRRSGGGGPGGDSRDGGHPTDACARRSQWPRRCPLRCPLAHLDARLPLRRSRVARHRFRRVHAAAGAATAFGNPSPSGAWNKPDRRTGRRHPRLTVKTRSRTRHRRDRYRVARARGADNRPPAAPPQPQQGAPQPPPGPRPPSPHAPADAAGAFSWPRTFSRAEAKRGMVAAPCPGYPDLSGDLQAETATGMRRPPVVPLPRPSV